MTLTLEIVKRAYRKIGVLSQGVELSAEEIADGLDALNAMIHGWKLRGVDTSHTDVSAGDAFPLAAEYEEGTVYLLASRLSPDYMIPQAFDADDWFRTFQAAYSDPTIVTMPLALTRMPSQFRRNDYN